MSTRANILIVAILLTGFVMFVGCRRPTTQAVQVRGSDTVSPLTQAWAEEFQREHPGIDVAVTGGGSGVGLAALQNQTTDIAMSSREIRPREEESMRANGLNPQEYHVASDAISIIVNPANSVSQLTIAQISSIYTGRIRNWNAVGGPDAPIIVLSRDRNSGTYEFFLEHVVREGREDDTRQLAPDTQLFVSNQPISQQVASNRNAIGYVGMGFYDPERHKALVVSQSEGEPYIEPTEDNVLDGDYPIARELYYYTPNQAEGQVKEFIDFVLSDQGQVIVDRIGFVPIRQVGG